MLLDDYTRGDGANEGLLEFEISHLVRDRDTRLHHSHYAG